MSAQTRLAPALLLVALGATVAGAGCDSEDEKAARAPDAARAEGPAERTVTVPEGNRRAPEG